MPTFIAVDTGGTFTDLVALNPETGSLTYTKSLTTHAKPIDAILNCIEKAAVSLADAQLFKHGTTLVINTLLERSGPSVALVTTKGFRDIIDLGRGARTEPFNLTFERSMPLSPRRNRFEIEERMQANGTPIRAPVREDVAARAAQIQLCGAKAVAVSFLNSYQNPSHEREVAGWLRELLPECFVTCGTDITREWYEFERSATALANAYVGPKAGHHFQNLTCALNDRGFNGDLMLMSSSGGVLSAEQSSAAPVLLVESGPVGGCIGAAAFAQALGIAKAVAFDMGGTTAKCSLIEDGRFDLESIYYIGGYGRGIPIRAPVLDIVEVGAGGGSIAWLDEHGGFHVGPQSAGSSPGPVAYGRGGTQSTVTDANLLLNRINADSFQGGEMSLDVAGATQAISTLATKMSYDSAQQVASGILAIANVTMTGAIKRITVERGKDPRNFVMFAYGGGGPLHGADLARALAIPTVIIPPEPSNFSAIGMLMADLRLDAARTLARPLDEGAPLVADATFCEMEEDLRIAGRSAFGNVEMIFKRHAELRFVGQSHAVKVDFGVSDTIDAIGTRFHAAYKTRFGRVNPVAAVEIVALHSVGIAQITKPELAQLGRPSAGMPEPIAHRDVFFLDRSAAVSSPVFRRTSLSVGWACEGPAIIEEYGSTTIVGPFDDVEVGFLGELVIHISRRAAGGQE